MKLILFLILAVGSLAQAAFVPPAEGPVPFRRDKLPVDVDTMMSLSKQLVVLAGATNTKEPTEARRAAQILGLSLALDPTNRQSREMTKSLERGKRLDAAGSNEINQATSRTWHLMGWLEQPEAGADGNALAACLADILKGVDPEHPRAIEMAGKNEQGKWNGWIAAVDQFKDDEPVMASKSAPAETPSEANPKFALKLNSASVEIPLWYTDKVSKKVVLRPVAVKMVARIDGGREGVEIKLPGRNQKELQAKIGGSLNSFLKARYGSVPKGLKYELTIDKEIPYSEKRNGNVLLGAILVLADSAFSGNAPEGIVFAEPAGDGSLKLPAKFWQTIRALADHKPGSRLIIPTAAKDFMAPLITLEKSEFFINFEVVMAKDADSLCKLASSSPPENVVAAHEAFEMIRKARGTRSLGGFLSHDSTQQRLKKVIALFPDHVSARMLALRGTSKWPKRLTREIYAREIRAAIAPLGSYFKQGGWMVLNGEEMENMIDESRERLAAVEKLFGSVGDRQELHAPSLNLMKLLGNLANDAKRSSLEDGSRWNKEPAFKEAWKEYSDTIQSLTFAAGDTENYPLPEKGEDR